MKKLTSLFLAVLIISLSVFSLSAFALPATESDAPPATETDPVPETELLFKKWYKEHGNEFSADVIASVSGNVFKGKAWFKDGNHAVTVNEMNGIQTKTSKVVTKDGKKILFWPDYPFFVVKLTTSSILNNSISNNSSVDIETYETTDGYHVEVLSYSGIDISMYFKNGELEKISISGSSLGTTSYEYIITSYEVDDSEFDTPVFAFNITPFFIFLILLFAV